MRFRPRSATPCLPRRRTLARALMLAGAAGLPATRVVADEPWPSRPLSLVVPFPPGGVADTVARPVAEALARTLGQPVVVENKAGAGGGIGMAQVARARPDGHTLLLALSSVTIIPEADRVLGRAPLYQLAQLVPLARFTADPTVLVVRAESPWRSLAEFLAHARARPGALTFGSSGTYGTMHVPMEMLKQATGSFMVHVPYTGAGPAVIGLLGGQVDALATGPATIVAHVRAGRLRALAHWGEGRLAALPEVPSLRELGVPVAFSQWSGLFAPAGTPEPVLARLRETARRAAEDERVSRTLGAVGSPIQFLDAAAFTRFVEADAVSMAAVVRRIGPQQ